MAREVPTIGSTVGSWHILERVSSGSFGVVFLARRAEAPDSPPSALKTAKMPYDPRFEREAELLRRCPHPSIPHLVDTGLWTGPDGCQYPFLVMEAVRGRSLYDWFQERQRSNREVLNVAAQLADALATAHAGGALHRDVKGGNICVTAEGRAVLLDWGSGWFSGAEPLTDSPSPPGTTAYRSPEQRRFSYCFRMDMDARWQSSALDDLYSLGVTLYRLVTGKYLPPLTDGGEPADHLEVPAPSNLAMVCPELEAIILRLLSENRKARGTAEQLARECAMLAQRVGGELDKVIVPTPSAMPTEAGDGFSSEPEAYSSEPLSQDSPEAIRTASSQRITSVKQEVKQEVKEDPRPSRHNIPAWFTWATASMVGGLVVALVLVPVLKDSSATSKDTPPTPQPAPWLATPEEIAQFAPDAGVVEEALTNVQDVPKAVVPTLLSLGRPMPSKPFPGQRRPPCVPRLEREIVGGCWLGPIKDQAPPCGNQMFDYQGECFAASYDQSPLPTSGTP
jgi:serine/threonine protein kinase